jgi:hypothetical protein
MNSSTWFKAAATLAFIQYAAHAVLFITAKPKNGEKESAVIESMRSRVPGMPRTYWQYYFGYGLVAILFGAVEIVLLWHASTAISLEPQSARVVALVFLVANLVHAALVWTYFRLAVPLAFDVLVAICLGFAIA